MNLTISVAIYNGEKYIDRCLASIVEAYNQVDKSKLNLTVLCIDDGSTDGSENILEEFSKKYNFIKILQKENGGLASVRNLAIKVCSSDYLWLIDVDDEITEDSLSFIINKQLGNINVFNYEIFSHKGDYLYDGYNVINNSYNSIEDNKDFFTLSTATWRYIYSVEFLKKLDIEFLENRLYEDLNWMMKIWSQSYDIKTFNKSIYRYYLTDGSIMRNTNLSRRKEIIDVLDDMFAFYKERKIFSEFYDELEYIAINNILYIGYISVFRVDKHYPLLDIYLVYLNENFKGWTNNKYYKKLPLKRKILLLCVKYRLSRILSLLLKMVK